jgi:predicted  nucleic acid-binding Zn-ribbon protein
MSIEQALAGAGAKAAGKRPWFLDEEIETVLNITLAVSQELATARQRVDTLERLLEAKGVLSREEIEAYAPDKKAAEERGLWTQEYIARVLRILQQRNEAAEVADDVASENLGDELAG